MWLIACDHRSRKCYISGIASWCDRCEFFPIRVDRVCHPLNLHEPKISAYATERIWDAVTKDWEKRNPKSIFGLIKFVMSILLLRLDSVKIIEKFWLSMAYIGEGNGNPLQYSCLENPMDRAWWTAVHGVDKSRTWLSDFTFTFRSHALEKEMATHSSVLAWRIPGMGEPGGLPSTGSHRVGHDWIDLAAWLT